MTWTQPERLRPLNTHHNLRTVNQQTHLYFRVKSIARELKTDLVIPLKWREKDSALQIRWGVLNPEPNLRNIFTSSEEIYQLTCAEARQRSKYIDACWWPMPGIPVTAGSSPGCQVRKQVSNHFLYNWQTHSHKHTAQELMLHGERHVTWRNVKAIKIYSPCFFKWNYWYKKIMTWVTFPIFVGYIHIWGSAHIQLFSSLSLQDLQYDYKNLVGNSLNWHKQLELHMWMCMNVMGW